VSWWLQVRAAFWLINATILVGIVLMVAGEVAFDIPAVLGGGTSTITTGVFASLAAAASGAYAFDTRGNATEARALRVVSRYDTCYFAAWLACLSLVVTATLSDRLHGMCAAVILGSVAVSVTCLVDAARGVLASTGLFLLTSTYSPHLPGSWMVRVLQSDANMTAAVVAALMAATTAVIIVRYGRSLVTSRPSRSR
jgi:hypothetical protein